MKKIAIVLLAAALILCAVSCAPQSFSEQAKETLAIGVAASTDLITQFVETGKEPTGFTWQEAGSSSGKGIQFNFDKCTSNTLNVQNITGSCLAITSTAEGSTGTVTIDLKKYTYESKDHSMYIEGTFSGSYPTAGGITITKTTVDGVAYDPNTL